VSVLKHQVAITASGARALIPMNQQTKHIDNMKIHPLYLNIL